MKSVVENYLNKEMDRKEFLRQVGVMLLAVIGVSSVLKYLSEQSGSDKHVHTSSTYGDSTYGGVEKHFKST